MSQTSQPSQPADDFDYTTDQSMRVARRVAHGVYRLLHGGQEVGDEEWAIFGLRNGSYRLMTDINLLWPVAHEQRAQLDVDERWGILGLWAQVDMYTLRRMATYVPNGDTLDVRIVETRLHEEEERTNRNNPISRNRSKPGTPASPAMAARPRASNAMGKIVSGRELPFSPRTHIDFASALLNFVVLQRLQLSPASQSTFDSVVVSLPSLEPLSIQQTYRYERDEALGNDPRRDPKSPPSLARRYTITEGSASTNGVDTVTTFWTDAHGIALRQQLQVDGLPHACEMVSYQWQG
jgi:hypothetical protein